VPKRVVFSLSAGRSGTRFLAGVLRRNVVDAVVVHEPYLRPANPTMFGPAIDDRARGDVEAVRQRLRTKAATIAAYRAPLYIETSHAFLKSYADLAMELFPDMQLIHAVRHPADVASSFVARAALEDRLHVPFRHYRGHDGRRYPRWHLTGREPIFAHFAPGELPPLERLLVEWIEIENRAIRFLDRHGKHPDTFSLHAPQDLGDRGRMEALIDFIGATRRGADVVLEGPRNRTPLYRGARASRLRDEGERALRTVVERLPPRYLEIFRREPYAAQPWAELLRN